MNKSDFGWLKTVGEVGSLGLVVLTAAGLGLMLGVWLDGEFGTSPFLAMTMTFLGLAAGVYESVKILLKAMRSDD